MLLFFIMDKLPVSIYKFKEKHFKLIVDKLYNIETMLNPIILSVDVGLEYTEMPDKLVYEYDGVKRRTKKYTKRLLHYILPDFSQIDKKVREHPIIYNIINSLCYEHSLNYIHTYSHIDFSIRSKLSIYNEKYYLDNDYIKFENILFELVNIKKYIVEMMMNMEYDFYSRTRKLLLRLFKLTQWSNCSIKRDGILLHSILLTCSNYTNDHILYDKNGDLINVNDSEYYGKINNVAIFFILL